MAAYYTLEVAVAAIDTAANNTTRRGFSRET